MRTRVVGSVVRSCGGGDRRGGAVVCVVRRVCGMCGARGGWAASAHLAPPLPALPKTGRPGNTMDHGQMPDTGIIRPRFPVPGIRAAISPCEISLAYGNGPVSHHITTTGRLTALVRTDATALYRP